MRGIGLTSVVVGSIVLSAHSGVVVKPDEGEATRKEIAVLQARLLPPAGTKKEKVDAVYGVPREVKEFVKGSATDYPMHVYQLLAPRRGEEFRAYLHITYRDGVVWRAGINHICVVKNRALYRPGPEADKQAKEIERENLQVLADLKEIDVKFGEKLKHFDWNQRTASEPPAAGDAAKPGP